MDDPEILEGRTEKYVDTPFGKVGVQLAECWLWRGLLLAWFFFFFKVKNSWFCVDNLKAGPGTGPAVLPQVHLLSCPEGCPRLLF